MAFFGLASLSARTDVFSNARRFLAELALINMLTVSGVALANLIGMTDDDDLARFEEEELESKPKSAD